MGLRLSAVAAAPAGSLVSNVIPFPRAQRGHAELEPEQALRRVRLAARAAGLTGNALRIVEAHAQGMLDGRGKPETVIESATRLAHKLVSGEYVPDGAA